MVDRKAMNVAFAYLTTRARTESEIRGRLASRSFSPEVIDSVLQKLHEYGYVDDQRYAQQFAQENAGRISSRMISNKLRQRGISRQLIEQIDTDEARNFEAALTYAKKAIGKIHDEDNRKRRHRLTQRLLYRGFDYDTAARVWDRLNDDNEP